jgi:hypothetical protein
LQGFRHIYDLWYKIKIDVPTHHYQQIATTKVPNDTIFFCSTSILFKQKMKKIFIIITITAIARFCITSCNPQNKKANTEKITVDTAIKSKSIVTVAEQPLAITDTGQQYFKVTVTKNNQPFAQYEGDFPIAMFDETNFNIQFPANKRMLKISHFLILYFKGIQSGSFAVAQSGSEKGKPTIIFTPEKDGNYGIGVPMLTGTVSITNYSQKTVTGTLEAEGKDTDGNIIHVKAAFINVKNNDLNK